MKIVYNSFHGRYSDSPRAMFERLRHVPGLEHRWLAHVSHVQGFPPAVATVDIDSADAVHALESADLVVANTHTEVEWRKAPQTRYLQSWHGTPMKRVHHDVLWAPPGRLARLGRDVEKWDVLLSPNAVSTPLLRRAFRFTGEIWETGYPRNDVLSEPGRRRRSTRALLGLGPETTVVLYAPTWRDDECFEEGRRPVPLGLDVQALVRSLGRSTAVLVRTHNLMTGRVDVPAGEGIQDVSYYPDVRDLYLAADVLVTDYSSVMFDFAITGKPMVFYTYDLARFRDSIRGFYFDLEPLAPGPLVHTVDDLADVLREPAVVRDSFEDRYRTFRQTFSHLEDGSATTRVLDRLGLVEREPVTAAGDGSPTLEAVQGSLDDIAVPVQLGVEAWWPAAARCRLQTREPGKREHPTSPADDTRFGSSDTADLAAGLSGSCIYERPIVAVGTGPSASPILPPRKGIRGSRHAQHRGHRVDPG
jgi:CDP-glycerol glycerophosphotransferase